MATDFLDPNTTESTINWTGGDGAPHHQAVDDGVDPPTAPGTGTSIASVPNANNDDVYAFNDISGSYSVSAMKVHVYHKLNSPGPMQISLMALSVNNGSSWLVWKSIPNPGTTAQWTETAEWTGPWTDISGLQCNIVSNDVNFVDTVYEITVEATYTLLTPEMNVKGNSTSIVDGDSTPAVADDTDYGSITVGIDHDHIFTVENVGSADLALTNSSPFVIVGGSHAADYSIAVAPTTPVTAAYTTTFTCRFTPGATGTRSATLSINNDDADENPYNWSIEGTGVAVAASVIKNRRGMMGLI